MIVDTKVSKRAVIRNLLKRRVRAILRAAALPSGDIIIRLRPTAKDTPFADLQQQVQKCLSQL